MKTRLITLTLGLLAIASLMNAQEVTAHPSLTMDGAKKVAEAAVAFAKSNGASPSIAIVDEGGHLLYFVRMDGSFAAGANVSIGKARTSATFKSRQRSLKTSSTKAGSR